LGVGVCAPAALPLCPPAGRSYNPRRAFDAGRDSTEDKVANDEKPGRGEGGTPQEKIVTPAEVDRSLREVTESLTQLRDSL
jgi:hypothetical protein